jgi:NitT/TauT family transport system ATP-binding protein
MTKNSPAFTCEHLSKAYRTRNGLVPALEDVTFGVGEQEFVCLVGPSGCGKTTLLKLIAGLLEPTSGRIVFSQKPPQDRPRSALVFQEHGLFPWMTVLDNVAFGLEMQGMGQQERLEYARAFIDKVGLTSFARSYPHELSVGMRQRVGIARAFVAGAPILLMDEPFGSLDAQTRRVLQEELLKLWKEHRKVVVYVTHDIEEAVLLGDRVLVMTDRPGSIREDIPIPLGRPRDASAMEQGEIKEIRWHVWKMLEDKVRKDLHIRA